MTPTLLLQKIKDEVRNKIFFASIDKNAMADILEGLAAGPLGSKVFHLKLLQAGTAAPTASVYVNTISSTAATYARTSAGLYTITEPAGSFTANKTVLPPPVVLVAAGVAIGTATFARTSDAVVTVTVLNTSGVATDLSALGGSIDDVKITVYS